MSRHPHGQLTSSTPELRAQLNRTNDQKGKNTIPASMACAWNPHVAIVCQTLEQQLKGMLAQLQSTNP
jgi:hypothetical protein